MRAVWSFWSKPYFAERRSSWGVELRHWLAWGLSLRLAMQHYPETQLVTDDGGARILIDDLQLPFKSVSMALNSFAREDPGWWALGKLEAYRIQQDPFVHIDTDVFLWKPLRPSLANADVFAQNPEPIELGNSCYRPEDIEDALARAGRAWLPDEWLWYRESARDYARAECCGILGGNRIDFIRYYATRALQVVMHRGNRVALRRFANKSGSMILIEQYLLSACVDYHAACEASPYSGISIQYVFDSLGDAWNRDRATEEGFTHLAAGAKRDPSIGYDLEIRVEQDYPEHFARCVDYVPGPLRSRSGRARHRKWNNERLYPALI